jgi:hypothetical protein
MRRDKRINTRIVDQDIDMAVSKFDRSSRNFTCTRSVAKVSRNKIRLPARCAYFGYGLFTPFRISAYKQYVHAQPSQFVGHGPTNTAGPSRNKCDRGHLRNPSSGRCAAFAGTKYKWCKPLQINGV